MERRTPDEWLEDERFGYCIRVLDPDGWDRKNYTEDWSKPLTEDEMHGKVMRSTIEFDQEWTETITCVRIFVPGHPGQAYIHPVLDDLCLDSLFDGAEVGGEYTIRVEKMKKKAFESLPEFDGF